ncbi:ribonuclease P protein subunit p40 isoform X3 [Anoplophora glabripennis]|uniref:ribonuclease P protein subunit p40 isoform X3 n=1 Tax=Anoplophora glabripennis TaxID=217634 RepID=UPI0008752C04|nr:ribonuclease P protein subunit p40 isoform X3 [Anoplophora glabripennis]
MLCPEVWNFEAPNSTFKFKKIYGGQNLEAETSINTFYYNHLVSVTLPDSLKFPESLTEKLILDCEYYKICDLNPSDLLNRNFLKFFIKSGKLTLLSSNTRIDCDNCIGITPDGQLILSVDKETFQNLGLDGKKSHFTGKNKYRYKNA